MRAALPRRGRARNHGGQVASPKPAAVETSNRSPLGNWHQPLQPPHTNLYPQTAEPIPRGPANAGRALSVLLSLSSVAMQSPITFTPERGAVSSSGGTLRFVLQLRAPVIEARCPDKVPARRRERPVLRSRAVGAGAASRAPPPSHPLRRPLPSNAENRLAGRRRGRPPSRLPVLRARQERKYGRRVTRGPRRPGAAPPTAPRPPPSAGPPPVDPRPPRPETPRPPPGRPQAPSSTC